MEADCRNVHRSCLAICYVLLIYPDSQIAFYCAGVNGSVQVKSKKEKQSFQSWLCCIRKPRRKRDSKNSRDGGQDTWSPVDHSTQQSDDENSSSSIQPAIPSLTPADRTNNVNSTSNVRFKFIIFKNLQYDSRNRRKNLI